jgi:hypothetical protein
MYAVTDDGSCLFDGCIPGCTQAEACNYDSLANAEDFSCIYGCVLGCMDELACNFNAEADFDNGSCLMPGCMVSTAVNYDSLAVCEGSCYFECVGDVDGSGAMDMNDFLMLMEAFGCIEDCGDMDISGDGFVGVTDLQLFLTQFGVLCVD